MSAIRLIEHGGMGKTEMLALHRKRMDNFYLCTVWVLCSIKSTFCYVSSKFKVIVVWRMEVIYYFIFPCIIFKFLLDYLLSCLIVATVAFHPDLLFTIAFHFTLQFEYSTVVWSTGAFRFCLFACLFGLLFFSCWWLFVYFLCIFFSLVNCSSHSNFKWNNDQNFSAFSQKT